MLLLFFLYKLYLIDISCEFWVTLKRELKEICFFEKNFPPIFENGHF